jgi:protein arginine kinase
MKIADLINSEDQLIHNIAEQQPVVLSTRIRLARNLAKFPFPNRATPEQKRSILAAVNPVLAAFPKLKKGHRYLIGTLPVAERGLLVERHLISKELANRPNAAAYISRDQTCSVMVNEEDHLRVQIVRGGYHLKQAWKQASALDNALAAGLKLAYSRELGHLTACPTNVGTGLRASAMLHLAGLVFTGQMERVVRAINSDGLAVRGWFGEGSDASGCVFQISNQHTLGIGENEILAHLAHWLEAIIEQEQNARLRLLEINAPKIYDQMAREIATLQNARLLTTAEAMTSLSFARLACDIGVLPRKYRALVDRLFIESQPAHIIAIANREVAGVERDAVRATFFRESTAVLPKLNFTILDHNEFDELAEAANAALASDTALAAKHSQTPQDKDPPPPPPE